MLKDRVSTDQKPRCIECGLLVNMNLPGGVRSSDGCWHKACLAFRRAVQVGDPLAVAIDRQSQRIDQH